MTPSKCDSFVKSLYVAYFFFIIGAGVWESQREGSAGPPTLLLIVLILHFMIGIGEGSGKKQFGLTDRYCNKTSVAKSGLALVTDTLLLGALVRGAMWMNAVVTNTSTQGDAAWSLTLAAVGNVGCIILRMGQTPHVPLIKD
tara:strand:+ start:81 stop:506 length:426 start_codon:yes stop_codon:yes gene_type:complete